MRHGFTLIELVLYMALIAILIPSVVLVLLTVNKNQQHVYLRTEIQNTAAIILSEIEHEIMHASKINISSSTLDSDQSVLEYVDSGNILHRFQYATDTVEFSSTQYNIGRLQFYDGGYSWLTSENIIVSVFRIESVRNSDSLLTGLNIHLTLTPLTTETSMDQANILELRTSIPVLTSATEQ